MNKLKRYTEKYFIDHVANFCIHNKIENIKFILKIEIIWQYIFIDWGTDFDDFLDAYGDYKYRIGKGTF